MGDKQFGGGIKDTLQNSRIEKIFYLTLIVTVLHGGLIIWELACGILKIPTKVSSSAEFSNIYLLFLGAYAGYKEFVRWWEDAGELDDERANDRVLQFQRGEIIVGLWIALYLVSLLLNRFAVISVLPRELERTTLQVFAVVIGSYGSKGLYLGKVRRKGGDSQPGKDSASQSDAACEAKVLEYVEKNGSITNEQCRNLLSLDRNRAFRILDKLERSGSLVSSGEKKGVSYVKK